MSAPDSSTILRPRWSAIMTQSTGEADKAQTPAPFENQKP